MSDLLLAALRRIDWKVIAATTAIAGMVLAWMITEAGLTWLPDTMSRPLFVSRVVLNLLVAYCTLIAIFVADEAVDRGARRLPAYAMAVIAGTAVAALAQVPVHAWLGLTLDGNGRPTGNFWQPIAAFLEYLLWASICGVVYVNRRTALLAIQRLNEAQLARARAQRQTLESRLQALQARIEPQFLSATLGQVRQLHTGNPARGVQLLDDLIVYLRAALPQLRESSSTVEQELALASAYLNIRQPDTRREPPRASASALQARMPPMLLLPLIDRLLAAHWDDSGSIRIAVFEQSQALRLEINGPGARVDDDPLLGDVRERLRVLYGERGRLSVQALQGRTRISLEVPHDAADGDHR